MTAQDLTPAAARAVVPASHHQLFDDIVSQRVLGANAHITMIGDMIEAIARDGGSTGQTVPQIVARIQALSQFFIDTRGAASQAVANAIRLMTRGIQGQSTRPVAAACADIIAVKDAYATTARQASDQAVAHAVQACANLRSILLYDYSSSVDKVVAALPALDTPREIIIAESRVINGGAPFVRTALSAGHRVRFIPDAALMYYGRQVEAVLMGAETFYADGTGFNTVGSDLVGLMCHQTGVPLYFVTPFIKLDMRPLSGWQRDLVIVDARAKLAPMLPADVDATAVDFRTPELVPVPAAHIRAFITEYGVIPAGQLLNLALRYCEEVLTHA